MTTTNTGRLSSSDPNLQNIPVRTEAGQRIRSAFIPAEKCVLLSADYSQIELRLLAHIGKIVPLQNAFRAGADIHALTASRMFGIAPEQVDSLARRRAKAINFGIIYGMSAFGLSQRLGIERIEAQRYIDAYFREYPGIQEYMQRTIAFAREHGYVETLFGRKCRIRGIHDKNPAMRQFSERAAINAPLQGTAADIIKKAMIALPEALQRENVDAALLLQVHDELVLEVQQGQSRQALEIVRKVMEQVVHLDVPLTVSVACGAHWAEIHG